MISCWPRPARARLAAKGSGAFVMTHVLILPRFPVNKSSESKRSGSLLLPEIHSRTKRAEQSLIIEGLGEERNGALCQRYFSYLIVCMSCYKDDRHHMLQLDKATLKLNTAKAGHLRIEDETIGVTNQA